MGLEIFQRALEIKDYAVKLRRHFHQNPELGHREYETSAFIRKELEAMGVGIVPIDVETGVLGILKGEKQGPPTVTALRADIDAIPVVERTGLPYASRNPGVMHGCGHDGHTAGLLGVAKLLTSMRDRFSGTVKFIFQPAEEILTGAKSMVEAGVLENPGVDTVVGLHAWPPVEVGKIGVYKGSYQASADKFVVTVSGRGAHGAYPYRAADALLAGVYSVAALQNIVSREIDALDKVALSVCTFHGGEAFNTMPEEVTFSGTVRCHDEAVRRSIEAKINRVVKGICTSYGCTYRLEYIYGVPPVVNDPEVIDLITEAANQALGEGPWWRSTARP
jgi:amidohydrolase/hippurate hydrolase